MRKMILALSCGLLFGAVCLMGACGATEEENFAAATEAFDNYTAHISVDTVIGTTETHTEQTIEIDGNKCRAIIAREPVTATLYLKEENGTAYGYAEKQTGWQDTDWATIEEALTDVKCYLGFFQTMYYSEMEKIEDTLCLKESMLDTYSSQMELSVKSLKVKLSGNKFESAELLGTTEGGKVNISYTFSDYGSTSVTLPV